VKPVLYTIDGCIDCHKAKQHLMQNHISFLEKNLFHDKHAALEVKEILGEIITPLYVDGAVILKGTEILKFF
jgi:glutaredoxin